MFLEKGKFRMVDSPLSGGPKGRVPANGRRRRWHASDPHAFCTAYVRGETIHCLKNSLPACAVEDCTGS